MLRLGIRLPNASGKAKGGAPATLPTNVAPPSISGSGVQGNMLTLTPGTWVGSAPIGIARQWKSGGVAIGGETGTTYVSQVSDIGTTVTCTESATNAAGGPITSDSNGIAITGAPTVDVIADETGNVIVNERGDSYVI